MKISNLVITRFEFLSYLVTVSYGLNQGFKKTLAGSS